MNSSPAKLWYLPVVMGIIFIALGAWVFATPIGSFVTLSMFFAVAFLITGLFETVRALSNTHLPNWGWSLAGGLIDLLLGILLISSPGLSMQVLALYVGFVILFRAFMSIGYSIDLKHANVKGWGGTLFLGILGVILAIMVIVNPALGGFTLVFYVAFAMIIIGILQILFGIMLRKAGR